MPPISKNEPRYHGVTSQRGTVDEQIPQSFNDNTTTPSDPSGSQPENYSDLALPDIEPPRGFDPEADRPDSCTSSQASTSSSTQSATNRLNNLSNGIDQINNGDINNHRTTSDNSRQVDGSQITRSGSTLIASTSYQSDDNSNNTQNKDTEPVPSTSFGIMNGLSMLVNRISQVFSTTSLSVINTDRCLQQDEMPKFAFAHKRSLEKTWKLMDRVVKFCQRPRMKLDNSPPFILEILPETYQHLKLIYTKYETMQDKPINDNEYSQVFLRNLQNRCKQTLKLFKDAREEMFDENSDYRHKLTRNTLVFNHILSELKAIFPNGYFVGDRFLITKKDSAGEFWKSSFGTSVLVDWKSFYHALQQVHRIDSSFFSLNALKQTIDLTCDDYISIFEFDVFTRLFQPWSTLLKNWQVLAVTHPGYRAFLTYGELKVRLQKHIDKPGSYIFRLSCTRLGQWAIGYVTEKREILQTIVQNISLSQALTETEFYLYPDGKDEDPNLSILCSELAGDDRNVTVTEEQYEIYCGVGNSFQVCKICFENDKDIRLEPCNHLLCTLCLDALQKSGSQVCPYCRTEIKESVQITMDLPKRTKAQS